MIRRCLAALVVALTAAGAGTAGATGAGAAAAGESGRAAPVAVAVAAQEPEPGPGYVEQADQAVPGNYIVTLRDTTRSQVGARARALVGAHAGRLDHVYSSVMRGFSAELTAAQAQRLSRSPFVAHVEEDAVVHALDTQTNPPWGLDRIDQASLPLNQAYNFTARGTGVHAYIIDTGIRTTHVDFGGRAVHGRDTVDGDNDATDCNGHGTHVAGTVGGNTYGVAKGVSLVAVRVLNCQGNGTTSGVIAGVDWVTANAVRPAVANMSLGGGASTSLDNAVRNSVASGVTYAIAAGNSNANACNSSPARVAEAVTVGATASNDARASFSNFGSCLDLFAPGVGILSAWSTSNTATNTINGTSMATPHVAGVAAQYLQTTPGASPAAVSSAIVTNATTGRVGNPGSGSPNRLLFSGFVGTPGPGPGPGPDPDPSTPNLTNGVATAGSNGATGTWRYYKIQVPSGAASLSVTLAGTCQPSGFRCNPDLDLFVRQGARPTNSTFACRSQGSTANEVCTVSSPAAGWWYVGIYTFSGGSIQIPFTVTARH